MSSTITRRQTTACLLAWLPLRAGCGYVHQPAPPPEATGGSAEACASVCKPACAKLFERTGCRRLHAAVGQLGEQRAHFRRRVQEAPAPRHESRVKLQNLQEASRSCCCCCCCTPAHRAPALPGSLPVVTGHWWLLLRPLRLLQDHALEVNSDTSRTGPASAGGRQCRCTSGPAAAASAGPAQPETDGSQRGVPFAPYAALEA